MKPERGWLELLVEALLPSTVAEEVLGDLREEFGGPEQGPRSRALRALALVSVLFQFAVRGRLTPGLSGDVRLAVRRLRRDPTFTVIAVVALSLGIGTNAAMLAVADEVLFSPLPYPNGDRLAVVTNDHTGSETGGFGVSWDNMRDVEGQARTMDRIALYLDWQDVSVQESDGAFRIPAAFVSDGYLELLDIRATLGRLFLESENRPGTPARVAILGRGTWRSAFASDPGVVGRVIVLNGNPYEIVGVVEDDRGDLRYRWGQDPVGIYLPLFAGEELSGFRFADNRGGRYFNAVIRARDGVSVSAVQEEMTSISATLARAYPEANEGWSFRVQALDEALFEALRAPTSAVLGISLLVLLLVAVNLLTLSLLRAAGRSGEVATQRALGASRGRIVRQQVTEGLLLATTGGLAGLLIAGWGIGLFGRQSTVRLPDFASVSLDARLVVVSGVASLALGLLMGLGPALGLVRGAGSTPLPESRSSATRPHARMRSVLVATEVALAFLLLVGAGLLLESYRILRSTGYGFDTERLLLAQVDLRNADHGPEELSAIADELRTRVRRLPGVEQAFLWSPNRLGHGNQVDLLTREGRWETRPEERIEASLHAVHPGTLELLGIRLVAGRDVAGFDDPESPRVGLVSESLAGALWPGEDPLGRWMETAEGGALLRIQVVGVVADARHRTRLIEPFGRQLDVYYAFDQAPWRFLTVALRHAPEADLEALTSQVRSTVREIDPTAPLYGITTMAERMREEEGTARVGAWLVGAYAALTMALAALGVYGVLAHRVRLQRKEIGIRMALGADRRRVRRRVVGSGMGLVALGGVVGLFAALGAGRLLAAALYGVEPDEPGVFLAVGLLLGLTGLVASWIPSLRATRVDPARVLRAD